MRPKRLASDEKAGGEESSNPASRLPPEEVLDARPAGKRKAEIEALEALPDEEIDTSDIPEILDWSGARRGLLYRPPKRRVASGLDAGVAPSSAANGESR